MVEQKAFTEEKLTTFNDASFINDLVKMLNPLANCDIKLYDLKL